MPALPRCEIRLSAVASGMRRPIRNTGALGREQKVAYVQVVVWTNTGWTEPRICHVNYPDLADQVLHKKQSFPDTPRACAAPQLCELHTTRGSLRPKSLSCPRGTEISVSHLTADEMLGYEPPYLLLLSLYASAIQ